MLLDLLLVSLVRPSLCFALAQVEVVQGALAQEPALPAEVEAIIQRLAGTRPWVHPMTLSELLPEFADLPERTALSQALAESQLRVQVVGDVPGAEDRLELLRALLGSQESHEELALRVAMARAELLLLSRGAEVARAALVEPYPSREEVLDAGRVHGHQRGPMYGQAVDSARLRAAFLLVLDEWTQIADRLEPEPPTSAAVGAAGTADGVWLSDVLDAESKVLLEERFGLPSAAIAERVGRELHDGGAEHLQLLGSVAVPALAFYAIAGEQGMAAFFLDPQLRLNPMLELARLEPSAAYELIAALAQQRDAEWRQGAVGAYLRASQGVPIDSASLWLRSSITSPTLHSRAPQRIAALSALLRDARTHGSLATELETLLELDGVPEPVAAALGACLGELRGEAALSLLGVIDPPRRSLRSMLPVLRDAMRHPDPDVRKRSELAVAHAGAWRDIAEIADPARREELLLEAYSEDSGEHRLGRTEESLGRLQPRWVSDSSWTRPPHPYFVEEDLPIVLDLFRASSTELRLALIGVVPCALPGAFEPLIQLGLQDEDERIRLKTAREIRFAREEFVGLVRLLPAESEIRDILQLAWLNCFDRGGGWNERGLLELSAPLDRLAQERLFYLLSSGHRLGAEVATHVASVLVASPQVLALDGEWRRFYSEIAAELDMEVELLSMAGRHGLIQLEEELLSVAMGRGRLVELIQAADAVLEPGWWAASKAASRGITILPREWAGERAALIAEQILGGQLGVEDGFDWVRFLEPFDLSESREAVLRLLEAPGLDLGRLEALASRPNVDYPSLWFGSPLPMTESASDLLRSILSSEDVHPEVRASAVAWFNPGLPNAEELARSAYSVLVDPERTLPPVGTGGQSLFLGVVEVLLGGDDAQRLLSDVRERTYRAIPHQTLVKLAAVDPAVGTDSGLAMRLLRDQDCHPFVQAEAVRLVVMSGSKDTRELLLDVLPGVAPDVRTEIRERISDLDLRDGVGAEPAVDETAAVRLQLLDWIASDRAGREQAIQSLGSVGTVSDLLLLIELTQAPENLIREAAKSALTALNARLAQ